MAVCVGIIEEKFIETCGVGFSQPMSVTVNLHLCKTQSSDGCCAAPSLVSLYDLKPFNC